MDDTLKRWTQKEGLNEEQLTTDFIQSLNSNLSLGNLKQAFNSAPNISMDEKADPNHPKAESSEDEEAEEQPLSPLEIPGSPVPIPRRPRSEGFMLSNKLRDKYGILRDPNYRLQFGSLPLSLSLGDVSAKTKRRDALPTIQETDESTSTNVPAKTISTDMRCCSDGCFDKCCDTQNSAPLITPIEFPKTIFFPKSTSNRLKGKGKVTQFPKLNTKCFKSTDGHLPPGEEPDLPPDHDHIPPNGNKNIVMCFDGTAEKFGPDPFTNVLKFFRMLDRTDEKRQICYYQPGIGTVVEASSALSRSKVFARHNNKNLIDCAIAYTLDSHIRRAYQFLMQNYENGDNIYFVGFSRGAFTARVLSGMIERVGLLSPGLEEIIPTAWNIYKDWEYAGQPMTSASRTLVEEFKYTFSRQYDVKITFMGLWDSVNSVGLLYDRMFPFTSNTGIIKHIRHAMSIDERRAKFKQYPFSHVYYSVAGKYNNDDPNSNTSTISTRRESSSSNSSHSKDSEFSQIKSANSSPTSPKRNSRGRAMLNQCQEVYNDVNGSICKNVGLSEFSKRKSKSETPAKQENLVDVSSDCECKKFQGPSLMETLLKKTFQFFGKDNTPIILNTNHTNQTTGILLNDQGQNNEDLNQYLKLIPKPQRDNNDESKVSASKVPKEMTGYFTAKSNIPGEESENIGRISPKQISPVWKDMLDTPAMDEPTLRSVWGQIAPANGPSNCDDVTELWFPGDHSDVGGGWIPNSHKQFFSNISLRWMIGEALKSGIVFREGAIDQFDEKYPVLESLKAPLHDSLDVTFRPPFFSSGSRGGDKLGHDIEPGDREFGRGNNSLVRALFWWVLELLPLPRYRLDRENEKWSKTIVPNVGKRRVVPLDAKFHWSVSWKEQYGLYDPPNLSEFHQRVPLSSSARTSPPDDITEAKHYVRKLKSKRRKSSGKLE